jgi:hypothetical protein
MAEERAFDLGDILAITHGYPITLDPYLTILAYLNQRPASVIDSRDAPAAWVLDLHPQLRDLTAPDAPRSEDGCFTDEQLAAWDAWAADAKARIGSTLTLQPIPEQRRDPRSLTELVLDTGVDPRKIWHVDLTQPDLGLTDPDNPA